MFSFVGRLVGLPAAPVAAVAATEEIAFDDDNEYVKLTDSDSSPSEDEAKLDSDYVDVPKTKQARFSYADDKNAAVTVTYYQSDSKANEGRVKGFQMINVYTEDEDKDDFVAVDIGVVPKKVKEAKELAVDELSFHYKLVTVNDLLLDTANYVTTTIKNPIELRQVCVQTITAALYKLTGVYFSVYWTPTGFDFRTDAIDIKKERQHFAFLDSFLQMTTKPLSFKRYALRGGKHQYIIDKIEVAALIDCLQKREASLVDDAKYTDNARMQYRLLKKYFELNSSAESKDAVSSVDNLLVSAASASRPYPHLRTRFSLISEAEKQAGELAKLEAKCKEKLWASSETDIEINEWYIKLCLKKAANKDASVTALLSDFDFKEAFAAYVLKLEQVRQIPVSKEDELTIIDNNAERILGVYQEFEKQYSEAPKESILKTTIAYMFESQYGFFSLDAKDQPIIDWKRTASAAYETRTVDVSENKLQQNIIAIQHHNKFVAAMIEIEPRLKPFVDGSQPWAADEIPVVPVYDQGQLYHLESSVNTAAKYYRLHASHGLEAAITEAVFQLIASKNKIKILAADKKTTIPTVNKADLYQTLLHKEVKNLAEHKISSHDLEQANDVAEAMIDYAIEIFDVMRLKNVIQYHQLEFLALCQVLFSHYTENFRASSLQAVVSQFDLTKPIAEESLVVEFSRFTKQLKQTVSSTATMVSLIKVAPEIKRDTKIPVDVIKAGIANEMLQKLEQFTQSWSTVKDAPIPRSTLANLIASIKANAAASPSFLVTLIVLNLRCFEVIRDELGCIDELADILQVTLARFEAEILKEQRERLFTVVVSDGRMGRSQAATPMPMPIHAPSPVAYEVKSGSSDAEMKTEVPMAPEVKHLPVLFDKLVSAPYSQSPVYDIEFVDELIKVLTELGDDTGVFLDQDLTTTCQHSGGAPFTDYISDLYMKAGKFDQVITQYDRLKMILSAIPESDKGIVSLNLNTGRSRLVAGAITIDKDRAFAFPVQLLDCLLMHGMTDETAKFKMTQMFFYVSSCSWGDPRSLVLKVKEDTKKAEQADSLKPLTIITGLTLEQIRLIRTTYDNLKVKYVPGKNLHLAFQIIVSNLQRHKQGKPFLKNVVLVDDDNKGNINVAKACLTQFLSELAKLDALKTVPGIATLKDTKLRTIVPTMKLRVDPSLVAESKASVSNSGLFTGNAAGVAAAAPKGVQRRYRCR